jgi:hypothetical protein
MPAMSMPPCWSRARLIMPSICSVRSRWIMAGGLTVNRASISVPSRSSGPIGSPTARPARPAGIGRKPATSGALPWSTSLLLRRPAPPARTGPCARRHLPVSAAAPAAWLSAANLSMKLCRRVASSRRARSGRNDIPVVPGSKALCRRAFGASDCAAAVMLDRPKPTSSTSSPQRPSTSPASMHGSRATFAHKPDSQNSLPWSQMPHEVNVGK